ncbi:phosphotransferase family protein [Peribacillus alkalitolerans]|uniref:phosphotransferase family protein n=1 Tax=Peribacillus alkalitolerans TaxID=1550385 RepID=UPI001F072ACB|nr:aminoglycoside phosphotransferase family protein [Peribacillus alkalitolerans]
MVEPIMSIEIPDPIKKFFIEIQRLEFPRQGWASDVAIVYSKKGTFALKRTKKEKYNLWLKKEIEVMNELALHTDLPIPKVFLSHIDDEQVWAVLEYFEGITLREALMRTKNKEVRRNLIFEFGATLNRIHSVTCPPALITPSDWLEAKLNEAKYNLITYGTEGTLELLDKLIKHRPEPIQPCLIHGDFTIDNVLVVDQKIVAIIDWSGGGYGDPRYDVSLSVRQKEGIFDHKNDSVIFYEGYGEKLITEEEYDYFENGLYNFF